MNYLKRMFSWKGYASRKEFFGYCLSYFSITGLIIWAVFFDAVILRTKSSTLTMISVAVIVLSSLAVLTLATVRRMRACAISPVWIVPVFILGLIPYVGGVLWIVMVIFLLSSSSSKQTVEDSPSFLAANIWFFCISLILPPLLLFSTVLILKPKKSDKPSFPPAYMEKNAPAANPAEQHPAGIPQEQRPLPAGNTAGQLIPAPEVRIFAQQKRWINNPQECSSACREEGTDSKDCRELVSEDKRWKLCLRRTRGFSPFYSQTLINPKGNVIEKIRFSSNKDPLWDKKPFWMVHFYKGEPKEIFINWASTVFYYILKSSSFKLDEETLQHRHPPLAHTSVSMQIHPDGQWNYAYYNPDGSSVTFEGYKHSFSTPWKGFNPSARYIHAAFPY